MVATGYELTMESGGITHLNRAIFFAGCADVDEMLVQWMDLAAILDKALRESETWIRGISSYSFFSP